MQTIIYDAQKHIDTDYIKQLLETNQGKKIICFGGGTAAEIFMDKFSKQCCIDCFLDNNQQIQGNEIFGKKIKSPEYLKELEKDSYIVLIMSKHVDAISKQLNDFGLKENTDYYDIYNKFIKYFRIKKYEKNALKFVEFIEKIPDGTFEKIPLKQQESIGIVCLGEMIQNLTWYSMAQGLLLRYNGYKSTLIIDTLRSFDSYIYFEGLENVAKVYIDYVVSVIKKKCSDIEVHYLDENEKASLDEEDIQMTQKYAPLVVKWLNSRRDEVFLPNDSNRIKVAEDILQTTMKSIKAYFEKKKYDTINVYTGMHRHRCVYTYVGKKMGMRVSTYDGADRAGGTTLYETDGVSGHAGDIRKILEEDVFLPEEKDKILQLAKKHFASRRSSTAEDKGYNFQTSEYSDDMIPYDVVIPFNIFWDSAALGRDYVFQDEVSWLAETLEYLMKETNATVFVREHPAQVKNKEFLFVDYSKKLPIFTEYPDRIRYVKAEEKVNTYQYIESCKLVLPYTSTIGVESVLLGTNVILHTNVYFDAYGIAYKAQNKKDYFEKISYCLEHPEEKICKDIHTAYFLYYMQMKHVLKTKFIECYTEWMDCDIEQLNQMEGVQKVLGVIAKNENAIIKTTREEL